MKIAILGTSGSGKSTLAKRLGERYGLPVLHMDTVHFLPGWVERPFAEEEAIVRQFLDENAGGWVIDGNYTKTCYARRLKEADKIIVMDGGKIAACGTHDELMQTSEIYREVYLSQNKELPQEGGTVSGVNSSSDIKGKEAVTNA